MDLTKNELEIMSVIWAAGRPLSASEILRLSENKTWKDTSLHIILNSLLNKRAIYEAGFVKSGKTYGRLFGAVISFEEYYSETVFPAAGEENIPHLFSALLKSFKITHEQITELELLLEQKKKEFDDE